MSQLSRTIGLLVALCLLTATVSRAAGATLGEQSEMIAKDGPASIRHLEDWATG